MRKLSWMSIITVLGAIAALGSSTQALRSEATPDTAKCNTSLGCTSNSGLYCASVSGGCVSCTQGGGFNEHCSAAAIPSPPPSE